MLPIVAVLSALSAPGCRTPAEVVPENDFRVLVFTKTDGYRHESIGPGVRAIEELGRRHRFVVDATEDASAFRRGNLERYAAVVFLNTTGDVLDAEQEAALRSYIRSGGGFVGIHAASDTEHDWAWYGGLVGARFAGHPPVQEAVVEVIDRGHPSTRHLSLRWPRRDEWYDFSSVVPEGLSILATLDESSYEGGAMGPVHPIVWCRTYEGGRSWYTGGGHTPESFTEPLFVEHLRGGIRWAANVSAEP